jgi:serine/threonine-protein kinase RsbW
LERSASDAVVPGPTGEAREVLLDLPSDPALMSVLDAVVSQVASDLKFDRDTVEQISVAVIEAGMNAMKHGNKFDPAKRAHFTFRVEPTRLTITVRDEGQGFDPDRVADPLRDENILRDTGRGILMIRAYMDDVYYSANGTLLTMVKEVVL